MYIVMLLCVDTTCIVIIHVLLCDVHVYCVAVGSHNHAQQDIQFQTQTEHQQNQLVHKTATPARSSNRRSTDTNTRQ